MADIFISYEREDRPSVERLARALEERGYKVAWDFELLDPPDRLAQAKAHIGVAKAVIVAWSNASIVSGAYASHRVESEAIAGMRRGVLVPILLAGDSIPKVHENLEHADLSNWSGETNQQDFDHLLAWLERLVANSGQAGDADIDKTAAQRRQPGGPITLQSAEADASAFAPKKLRRRTPELVRIVIHQPSDLKRVTGEASIADQRSHPVQQHMGLGHIGIGSPIGVAVAVYGGSCEGTLQRGAWTGEPLSFDFAVEANDVSRQVLISARVFIGDAQIGAITFTRPIGGRSAKPASTGDGQRLKRYDQVFISYSSEDRHVVSMIAKAYQSAGVAHFWDRSSLKSGEEWSPRLQKEIERADLFHLCWSKSAAASEWVEREANYALMRRRSRKQPDITIQMLDGPPWAPHPESLDILNFDDYTRAAVVGYARGDGSG